MVFSNESKHLIQFHRESRQIRTH